MTDEQSGKYVLSPGELTELFVFDADGAGTLEDVVLTGCGDQPGQVASNFEVGSWTDQAWRDHRSRVAFARTRSGRAAEAAVVKAIVAKGRVEHFLPDLNEMPDFERIELADSWVRQRPLA